MAFNTGWFDENKASISNDVIAEKIKDKSHWFIFPYDFINMQANTEAGLKPANSHRNAFTQWSEIVKGNTSIFLNPTNSTELIKHQGTGSIDDKGNVNGSYYDVKYSKDNSLVFKGLMPRNSGGVDFDTTDLGGFGTFTSIQDSESISMITNLKVSKEMLTKFYLIPNTAELMKNGKKEYDGEFDDNDIFYIDSYENHYNENSASGKDFVFSEITFTNIKNMLRQSGQTIEQHIYFGAPGQGYLIPKLIFDDNGYIKDWEWNKNFSSDKGIKTIQLDWSGNFAPFSIDIWGIPVDPNNNTYESKRWYAPRKLVSERFELPFLEDFYKVTPNNNTFVYTDVSFEATADFGSYKRYVHDIAGDSRMQYQGIINTNKGATQGTNPNGALINDQDLGVSSDWLGQFDKLNATPNQFYFQNDKAQEYGTKTLDLTKLPKRSNSKSTTFMDVLNQMSFYGQFINKLPFETTSKYTWSLNDIPIFGGFLSKWTFGIPFAWRHVQSHSTGAQPTLQKLPMMMTRDMYSMVTESFFSSNTKNASNSRAWFDWSPNKGTWDGKVPIDFFQKAESDILGSYFGNKSTSTSLTFTLTDKVNSTVYAEKDNKELDAKNFSTVMLGQHDGDNVYLVNESTVSIPSQPDDSRTIITDVNGYKYILTGIGFKGIGDGDVRITAYNIDLNDVNTPNDPNYDPNDPNAVINYQNYVAFQTFMHTQAGYKNNQIREWFTMENVSYLDALDQYLNDKFKWPQAIPTPKPTDLLDTLTNKAHLPMWYIGTLYAEGVDTVAFHDDNTATAYIGSVDNNSSNNIWKNFHILQKQVDIELFDFSKIGYTNFKSFAQDYESINIKNDDFSYGLISYDSWDSGNTISGAHNKRTTFEVKDNDGNDKKIPDSAFINPSIIDAEYTYTAFDNGSGIDITWLTAYIGTDKAMDSGSSLIRFMDKEDGLGKGTQPFKFLLNEASMDGGEQGGRFIGNDSRRISTNFSGYQPQISYNLWHDDKKIYISFCPNGLIYNGAKGYLSNDQIGAPGKPGREWQYAWNSTGMGMLKHKKFEVSDSNPGIKIGDNGLFYIDNSNEASSFFDVTVKPYGKN